LTPEERAYNEQLRLQGDNTKFYHGADGESKPDKNFGQKVVDYLTALPFLIAYAIASGGQR
jgi:hypothetical protein